MDRHELREAMKQTKLTASLVKCSINFNDPEIVKLFCGHYEPYTLDQITKALLKVQGECEFFSLAAVKSRIDDGRPEPDEAWGLMPVEEGQSVVWTDEMAEAFGAAIPLLDGKANISARMAFIAKYKALVSDAKLRGVAVKWSASLGYDQLGRQHALTEAVNKGRITKGHAVKLLPSLTFKVHDGGRLLLKACAGEVLSTEQVKAALKKKREAEQEGYAAADAFQKLAEEVLDKRAPYTGGQTFEAPTEEDIEKLQGVE